jgi:hypothetical protein
VIIEKHLTAALVCSKKNKLSNVALLTTTSRQRLAPSPAAANLIQVVSAYLYNGPFKAIGFSPPQHASVNWFLHLTDLTGRDCLVDVALQSLSLAHLGKTSHDEHIGRIARRCYGSALRQLQVAATRGQKDANLLSAINFM